MRQKKKSTKKCKNRDCRRPVRTTLGNLGYCKRCVAQAREESQR